MSDTKPHTHPLDHTTHTLGCLAILIVASALHRVTSDPDERDRQ